LILIAVVFLAAAGLIFLKGKTGSDYIFVEAKKGTLFQEVSVSGQLKPSQSLDLGFEVSGKVSRIFKQVGDEAFAGQRIIELDSSQLLNQLAQAEANLEAENSRLEELKKGTRIEELEAARNNVLGLEKSLTEAKTNLKAIENKAVADLDNAYSSALTSLQKSVSSSKTSLFTLTDIQYSHYYSDNDLADAKARAILSLLGANGAGRWTNSAINSLSGGAFGQVQKAISDQSQDNIDLALSKTEEALQTVKDALNAAPITDLISTEKTNLSTEKSNILAEISTIASKKQAILVQKTTNDYNEALASSSVTTAGNALKTALDQLKLKEAGATLEQISIQEAIVKASKAALENIKTQVAKTVILSPISGVITKRDVDLGESVVANTPIVSLMSASGFSAEGGPAPGWEIETRVAEVDIAKIKIGDSAKVTLDAYGSDLVFGAKVVKIDPAETMIEGLPTYKVSLEFIEKDDRLRSGMTADIDILTAEKQDVILVPQRAVISTNGDKLVRVLEKGNQVKEVKVKTGLRGSNGEIEIVEGLSEGDKVITSMPGK